MAQKILARHASRREVAVGEYVWAKVPRTGITGPIKRFAELGVEQVFDADGVWAVDDHYAPAPTVISAERTKQLRTFARRHRLPHYFEHGRHGIQHQLFPEHGFVVPGDLVASVDSHSTSYGAFNAMGIPIGEESAFVVAFGELWFRVPETVRFDLVGDLPAPCVGKDVVLAIAGAFGTDVGLYKALEFHGPAATAMRLGSRFSIANMGAELGAKCAMFEADDKTFAFLRGRTDRPAQPTSPDPDAVYAARHEIDVGRLEPQVALPPTPGNVRGISEIAARRIRVDQAFLGSCTNGRLEDIEVAVEILRGRKVHPDVRFIVTPASSEVWLACAERGHWTTLATAGALVTNPGCGACIGGHLGVLAAGEVCVSTSNRNFPGRMGSSEADVYLANPAVVAASAVKGFIADPRELMP